MIMILRVVGFDNQMKMTLSPDDPTSSLLKERGLIVITAIDTSKLRGRQKHPSGWSNGNMEHMYRLTYKSEEGRKVVRGRDVEQICASDEQDIVP